MNRAAIAALLIASLPAIARAQPRPERPGEAGDRRELREDRRQIRDDFRDLAYMERLLTRFDDARGRRSKAELLAVEDELSRAIDREVREARVELARDRESRRDGGRVDRREVRDDRRDLRRVSAIREDLQSLRGRMTPRALDRKRALVVELVGMARAEVHEDRAERREERREQREFRR